MVMEFWETLCGLLQFFRIAFYLSAAILSVAVLSLLGIQTTTAQYYITLLTIAINASVALGSGYIVRKCANQYAE